MLMHVACAPASMCLLSCCNSKSSQPVGTFTAQKATWLTVCSGVSDKSFRIELREVGAAKHKLLPYIRDSNLQLISAFFFFLNACSVNLDTVLNLMDSLILIVNWNLCKGLNYPVIIDTEKLIINSEICCLTRCLVNYANATLAFALI